jgi:hypothetical protein
MIQRVFNIDRRLTVVGHWTADEDKLKRAVRGTVARIGRQLFGFLVER